MLGLDKVENDEEEELGDMQGMIVCVRLKDHSWMYGIMIECTTIKFGWLSPAGRLSCSRWGYLPWHKDR